MNTSNEKSLAGSRRWGTLGVLSLVAFTGGILVTAGLFAGDMIRVMWFEELLGPDSDAMSGSMEAPALTTGLMLAMLVVAAVGAVGVITSWVQLRKHRESPGSSSRLRGPLALVILGIPCSLFLPHLGVPLLGLGIVWAAALTFSGSSQKADHNQF